MITIEGTRLPVADDIAQASWGDSDAASSTSRPVQFSRSLRKA